MFRRRDKSLDLRIRIANLEAELGFVVSEPELLHRSTGRMRTPAEEAAAWSASASAKAANYTAGVQAHSGTWAK